jgi:hypothetical protein
MPLFLEAATMGRRARVQLRKSRQRFSVLFLIALRNRKKIKPLFKQSGMGVQGRKAFSKQSLGVAKTFGSYGLFRLSEKRFERRIVMRLGGV